MKLICASCNKKSVEKAKDCFQCSDCGHTMALHKSKKELIARQASTHISKNRKPSLPILNFMKEK